MFINMEIKSKVLEEFYCDKVEVGLASELLRSSWIKTFKPSDIVWVFRGYEMCNGQKFTSYELDSNIVKIDISSKCESKVIIKRTYRSIVVYKEEYV